MGHGSNREALGPIYRVARQGETSAWHQSPTASAFLMSSVLRRAGGGGIDLWRGEQEELERCPFSCGGGSRGAHGGGGALPTAMVRCCPEEKTAKTFHLVDAFTQRKRILIGRLHDGKTKTV
jgi:hypothetical protein